MWWRTSIIWALDHGANAQCDHLRGLTPSRGSRKPVLFVERVWLSQKLTTFSQFNEHVTTEWEYHMPKKDLKCGEVNCQMCLLKRVDCCCCVLIDVHLHLLPSCWTRAYCEVAGDMLGWRKTEKNTLTLISTLLDNNYILHPPKPFRTKHTTWDIT